MKKVISIVLIIMMTLGCVSMFASCNTTKNEKYKIGICQLVTHDALDAATKGFKDAIIEKLGEENVEFDYQNAAGSSDTCVTIANNFVTKKYDLIMANATPALQACANATLEIPVLGTSITEYGVALSIENFSGTVGGNISGTTDLAPLDKQAQMILDFYPDIQTVGILYCSAEANSAYQVKVVKEYLEAKNVTVKTYTFSDSNDVAMITEAACGECQALYIPTDNTAASCSETINGVAIEKKIPIFCGEENTCRGCGIVTLTINYYDIGYATGLMAVEILTGKADISKMPVQSVPAEKALYKYNEKLCAEYNITVPENYTVVSGTEIAK